MLQIIDTVLLAYLCIAETYLIYKQIKPKRKYNRKVNERIIKVYSNRS